MTTKAGFILLGLLLLATSAWPGTVPSAEANKEIIVRASKHEGFNRVVFEATDDAFIKATVVTTLQNQIIIRFPSNVELKAQTRIEMATSLKNNTYTINVNPPFKVKVSQLSTPPRLSVDIIPPAKTETVKTPVPEGAMTLPNLRIVLDPGHGGYDLGIVAGDLREKDATLSVARALETALIKKGRSVYLTRKADQYLSLTDRALFANQKAAELFISIHVTNSGNFIIYTFPGEAPSPDSVDETYGMMTRQRAYVEKSKALAESFGKALTDEFKKDVELRKMELPVLGSVGAPAIMVEVPVAVMSDSVTKAKLSETFLKGIAAYGGQ